MRELTCDILERTPIGAVAAVMHGDRVLTVRAGTSAARLRRKVASDFGRDAVHFERNEAGLQLREYFEGSRKAFSLDVDLSGLPPFTTKALSACAAIPYGETVSYRELARLAGVGQSCRLGPGGRTGACEEPAPHRRAVPQGARRGRPRRLQRAGRPGGQAGAPRPRRGTGSRSAAGRFRMRRNSLTGADGGI